IHTADPDQAVYFGAALDYYRVIVNNGTVLGSTGGETGLAYTFTIGTGFAGKSSVDCNVGPDMLVNWKRIAFPLQGGWLATRGNPAITTNTETATAPAPSSEEIQALVLRILREELHQLA
ncbi:MAG: Aldehyde-alcohol dehydrogenase, partial [Pseudomonadota bacterium]